MKVNKNAWKETIALYTSYHSGNNDGKLVVTKKKQFDDDDYSASDEVGELIQSVSEQIITKLKEEKIIDESQAGQILLGMTELVKTFKSESKWRSIINLIAAIGVPFLLKFISAKKSGGGNDVGGTAVFFNEI